MGRLAIVLVFAGIVFVGIAGVAGSAHAQNFAPIAQVDLNPQQVLIGEVVTFSADQSTDPDDGPSPLSFLWDFGDGTVGSGSNPTHVYTSAGLFSVSVTVSDGAANTIASVDAVVLSPVRNGAPSRSGPIAVASDGLVWVANPDSGTITRWAPQTNEVLEYPVCTLPQSVAIDATDTRVLVVCEGENRLVALAVADPTGPRLSVPVGNRPYGVAVAPGTGTIVVTSQSTGTVELLDGQLTSVGTASVKPDPRAVAITHDGSRAYVSHFLTRGSAAVVTELNLETLVAREITLALDPSPDTSSSGGGYPNVLGAVAIHPDGNTVWVAGLKSNTGRGIFRNGLPLLPRNRLRGLVAPVDIPTATERIADRIDTNNADSASAVAFSLNGRYAFVAHRGAGSVSIYDLPAAERESSADGDAIDELARFDVGDAPNGLVLSGDGDTLYVNNALSRDVIAVDVSLPASPAVIARVSVTAEPLPADVALGKKLFSRSREPVHSEQNYISCWSCHPDAGSDGRTWDFTQAGEGLRNTIDLRGRGGVAHGPVHWSANFDEIQDFENDIVNGFGGTGLAADGMGPHPPLGPPNGGRGAALDALASYLGSLNTPLPSPWRDAEGQLTAAALRGREIFYRADVGCAGCHVPPRFTDSEITADPDAFALHDVGTLGAGSGQRLGSQLQGIDTPTLLAVWSTPPYLHDGSAPTLLEVLTTRNGEDLHGATSQLAQEELDDLITFLVSLQGSEDEGPPTLRSGAGCTQSKRQGAFGGVWLFVLLVGTIGRFKRPR